MEEKGKKIEQDFRNEKKKKLLSLPALSSLAYLIGAKTRRRMDSTTMSASDQNCPPPATASVAVVATSSMTMLSSSSSPLKESMLPAIAARSPQRTALQPSLSATTTTKRNGSAFATASEIADFWRGEILFVFSPSSLVF